MRSAVMYSFLSGGDVSWIMGGRWLAVGRLTLDIDGWRVAAGLHYTAEKDRDVAGHYFVSRC